MKFELKGYDVTYDKEKSEAVVYKDDYKVMQVGFDAETGIYDIVGGVAVCMVHNKLLAEEDIEDVIDACGMSMDAVREVLQEMRASKRRIFLEN